MLRTGVACVAMLLSGCSFLDQLALDDGASALDPTKIYLNGADEVSTRKYEIERYACLNGPLVCNSGGAFFECGCTL